MNDEHKGERIKEWLKLLSVFPDDSEAGRLCDKVWRDRLAQERQELEKRQMVSQLNLLAELSRAKNSLRGLIP